MDSVFQKFTQLYPLVRRCFRYHLNKWWAFTSKLHRQLGEATPERNIILHLLWKTVPFKGDFWESFWPAHISVVTNQLTARETNLRNRSRRKLVKTVRKRERGRERERIFQLSCFASSGIYNKSSLQWHIILVGVKRICVVLSAHTTIVSCRAKGRRYWFISLKDWRNLPIWIIKPPPNSPGKYETA